MVIYVCLDSIGIGTHILHRPCHADHKRPMEKQSASDMQTKELKDRLIHEHKHALASIEL